MDILVFVCSHPSCACYSSFLSSWQKSEHSCCSSSLTYYVVPSFMLCWTNIYTQCWYYIFTFTWTLSMHLIHLHNVCIKVLPGDLTHLQNVGLDSPEPLWNDQKWASKCLSLWGRTLGLDPSLTLTHTCRPFGQLPYSRLTGWCKEKLVTQTKCIFIPTQYIIKSFI